MAHLSLTGVSEDGQRLLLSDGAGTGFWVDIDPRLRAAVQGEHTPGDLETPMESLLRPREIQARIRAGATPEAVAEAAQTTVEKIMAFAAPVLAERQHIVERAQRSSVRSTGSDAPTVNARSMGQVVTARVRSENIALETIEWDAWRREDGRWSVVASFPGHKRRATAEFTFDAPGNYVTADNDDAQWLVTVPAGEDEPDQSGHTGPAVTDDLRRARARRLASVPEGDLELPLGDDAIELVESAARSAGPDDASLASSATGSVPRVETDAEETEHPHEAPTRRQVKKTRGRASVPSWDEIMFGGKSD